MGCCLNKETSNNELLLHKNKDNNQSSIIDNTDYNKPKQFPKTKCIKTKNLEGKMSLKSNKFIQCQRKLSMVKDYLNFVNKSSSQLTPKMTFFKNSISSKEDKDKDYQSDDEPLQKRISLHISKFLFVFQDKITQEQAPTLFNENHKQYKPKLNKKKRKNQQALYQSPYEGEIDLAFVYFQFNNDGYVNELITQ